MNHLVKVDENPLIFGVKSVDGQFGCVGGIAFPVQNDATHYFVDYENGHATRLKGFELLQSKDKVFIFYTAHAKTAPIALFGRLEESPADFYWIEAPAGEQAADKYLIAFFSADAAVNGTACKYAVVSEDKGYDSFVRLVWQAFHVQTKRTSALRVKVAKSSESASNENESKKAEPTQTKAATVVSKSDSDPIVQAINGIAELSPAEKDKATKRYLELKNSGKETSLKHLAHDALQSALEQERGRALYRKYKKLFGASETTSNAPKKTETQSSKTATCVAKSDADPVVQAIKGIAELSPAEKDKAVKSYKELKKSGKLTGPKQLAYAALQKVLKQKRGRALYLKYKKQFVASKTSTDASSKTQSAQSGLVQFESSSGTDPIVQTIKSIGELSSVQKNEVAQRYLSYVQSGRKEPRKHLAYCALQNVLKQKQGQDLYRKYKKHFDAQEDGESCPNVQQDRRNTSSDVIRDVWYWAPSREVAEWYEWSDD